ncbi:MAG: substrate-binding periplasmic protein [Desulfobacterales bacterium]
MNIKVVIAILSIMAVMASGARAQEMFVLTEESPPFNFVDHGRATGSSTEVVREMLHRLRQPDRIQVLPWARAYHMLQSRPNVALFSTTRTPEREDRFHWVGPLFTVHYGFYARKDRNLEIDSLEDAKKARGIATYRDDVKEQLLESIGFSNLDSSNSPSSSLKKLMNGRVDLWLFDNLGMPDVARQQNVDPSELELALPFKSYQAYVAISGQTPTEVVRQWRSAFRSMVEDGSFFDISRRWLPPESIPDTAVGGPYASGSPAIQIYTEDSPPGNYLKDGKPAGLAVDVVREILKRLRRPDTITVVPWSRGYQLAQNAPNVAIFATTRLEQRESRFHWVGPLYHQKWGFYGRKGSGIRIRSLEEARKIRRIGTYLRDAKAEYLESQGFEHLLSANHNISNIRHLMRGDIDLWVSSDFNMPYQARQAGFDPGELELVFAFRDVSNYIAFSLGTPLSVVLDFQRCLDEIKSDGTYQRIVDNYRSGSDP